MNGPRIKLLACDEFQRLEACSRRQALTAGTLGLLGACSASSLRGDQTVPPLPGFGKAKACILVFVWGGPSHLETWDPKPGAPKEIRGEFKAIDTKIPGIQIGEHFPKLAALADHYSIIRSLNHDDPAHLSSVHLVTTGRTAPNPRSDADPPSRKDWPHIGSALMRFRAPVGLLPQFVMMPWSVNHPSAPGGTAPGQHAGQLGAGFDPFVVGGKPGQRNFEVPGLGLPSGVTLAQFQSRRELLELVDSQARDAGREIEAGGYSQQRERALSLVTAASARQAFDLSEESAQTRDRYGRHIHGQCLLLARRLVERDVPFVCVNWHNDRANFWDTHGDNFKRLKKDLMPPADRGFSALLEDLHARGKLDETLVVWVGEFGRAPVINGSAGRDHYPYCYSGVVAGAGVRGGQVYGKSDARGGLPAADPVSPGDLAATMYHALGIAAETYLPDRDGRPVRITEGQPLVELFS